MNIINRKNDLILERNFLDRDCSKLYLLGINYQYQINNTLRALQNKNIKIEGIIDDYYMNEYYEGYKVFKMKDIPKEAFVISMVTANHMWTVIKNLKLHGIDNILTYWDLCLVDNINLPLPYHCENNVNDIKNNKEEYVKLYEYLEDVKSKEILTRLIDFRYNFNIEPMEYFVENISSKQYFDEIITELNFEVFVDCGGFDGMTTIDFINSNPNYKKVYYFEPSPLNMDVSRGNLKSYANIVYLEKGTYSENKQIRFDVNQGSSASISDSGEDIVNVVKLDDVIEGNSIFIKMDIEGAEYDSLLGAEKLIKEKKPVLAICVYHDQSHFWKIPKLVKGMREDYKVYLRHYSEGNLETVMSYNS